MSGRRSLWVYVLTLLSLLVLLFFYGAPILLAAIVVLLLLPLPLGLGLRRDAKLIQLECQYPAKVQVGQKTELRFLLHRKRMLFSGRCAYVTILVHNTMTGQDTLHDLCMPIWGDGEAYVLEEPLQECGELVVSFQKG